MHYEMVTPLGGPNFPQAIGAAFNTFTTRQDVSPFPLPVANAGSIGRGQKIEIECVGEVNSTGSPTLVLGFYIGTQAGAITTVIAESSANTVATAVLWPFNMRYTGIFTNDGVSGTLVGQGLLNIGTSLTAMASNWMPITKALRTITWDTTIARAIGVCATWNASSASNQVQVYDLRAQLVN